MRPENWARHLLRCSEKLQGVQVTNFDFTDVIEQIPDNAFLFVDPPYFNADQDKFYTHSFTLADHYRLAMSLQKHANRLSFLLTYDDAPEIRDLYAWTINILERQWNYTINRTNDQKSKTNAKGKRSLGRELFIMNYSAKLTAQPQLLRQLTLPHENSVPNC
jgi:DNA adenine methylase